MLRTRIDNNAELPSCTTTTKTTNTTRNDDRITPIPSPPNREPDGRCFFRPTAGVGGSAMTSALVRLIPLGGPHLRKGEIDMALLKHQAVAVAVGLAVSV